ncbi:hypothetical protein ACHAXR_004241, partial [Thalassiosira sp. AJA248-18]
MNSRPLSDDHELSSSTSSNRVSARSRFSAPPAAAFGSASYDYGNNDMYRSSPVTSTTKSKGGINGRSYEEESDGEYIGLNERKSALRSAAKQQQRSGGQSGALNDDFRLARQRSSGSAAAASKDRPWRTASGGTEPSAAIEVSRNRSNDSTGSIEVTTSSSNRWSQYETDDLAEESRKATSNAVVDMATKIADRQQEAAEEVPMLPSSPMGGSVVGTGYRDDENEVSTLFCSSNGDDLERNGNSLPPSMPNTSSAARNNSSSGISSSSQRSTTDYVKSRLSSLMTHRNNSHDSPDRNSTSYERGLSSTSSTQSDHDKVRNEALKMLQIADSCLQDSPRNSAPNSPRSSMKMNGNTTGLFRTAGGGLAMRELHNDEVHHIQTKRSKGSSVSSIAGIDKFHNSEKGQKFDGTFTIGSQDEEDLKRLNSNNSSSNPASPNEDTPSMWSSRYSVERQLMAITGGLDSTHMLAKMDILHSSREKTKSARGLYRASGYALDGSHEEYNDYTNGNSSGVGLGSSIWTWLRGTLWSDDLELNSDGTTQSLVRREIAMRKRKRIRYGALFFVGLSVIVGVLVHVGNPKSGVVKHHNAEEGDVNFYVLADEPYQYSNSAQLTRELEALPPNAEFVIHLGNANGDKQSRCQEYGFERVAAVLKESPVPVLVIPGDLDWAACESKSKAEKSLMYWDINLGQLESHWDDSPLDVDYSDDVVGNFAFLH